MNQIPKKISAEMIFKIDGMLVDLISESESVRTFWELQKIKKSVKRRTRK